MNPKDSQFLVLNAHANGIHEWASQAESSRTIELQRLAHSSPLTRLLPLFFRAAQCIILGFFFFLRLKLASLRKRGFVHGISTLGVTCLHAHGECQFTKYLKCVLGFYFLTAKSGSKSHFTVVVVVLLLLVVLVVVVVIDFRQ